MAQNLSLKCHCWCCGKCPIHQTEESSDYEVVIDDEATQRAVEAGLDTVIYKRKSEAVKG